jgi:putative SOS response-associated peptidase YedK
MHDRQMVILDMSNWSAWFQETGNEKGLLRALPAGSLMVEQIRPWR